MSDFQETHNRYLAKLERMAKLHRENGMTEVAVYYEERLKASAEYQGIFSRDPEAKEKLRAKIESLEKERAEMKRINRHCRLNQLPPGFPTSALRTVGTEILRYRSRLEDLEAKDLVRFSRC